MLTRFSKPSGDIAMEGNRLIQEEAENLRRERLVSALLAQGEAAGQCRLCAHSLQEAKTVPHRRVPYRLCPRCGHFQSANLPSREHREGLAREIPFHAIYRPLEDEAYQSRVDRIYRPKLEWVLEAVRELGWSRERILEKTWLELGCGAGFFLKALRDAGAGLARGIDQDPQLVAMANQALTGAPVSHFAGALPEALRAREAGVYAAFFVLEHAERLPEVLAALREKPAGTLFCFSVPVIGLGALLESAFDHFYARNLDSGVHTQLFTDQSIAYALEAADYRMVSQWVFGQDAADLLRMVLPRLEELYPPEFLEPVRRSLLGLQDDWQAALDRRFLADSRHVLAVKR